MYTYTKKSVLFIGAFKPEWEEEVLYEKKEREVRRGKRG